MANTAATPKPEGARSRVYFWTWLALGGAAIFYITVAMLAPEALRSAEAGGLDAVSQQLASLSGSIAQIKTRQDQDAAKVASLGGAVQAMHNDMAALGAHVDQVAADDERRLIALEAQAPLASKAPAAGAVKVSQSAPKVDGVVVAGNGGADAEAAATVAPADTGVAAAPPPKPKPYAVSLAVSTSPDALRQLWQLFKDEHGDLLAGLTPRSVGSGGNVRLLAGPFPTQAAAVAQCGKMRKAGMDCSATPMAGTPL